MKNKQFLDLIHTRRSCRSYETRIPSKEELIAVLEAGTYAPTAHGLQDPVIVCVTNQELRNRLSAFNRTIWGKEIDPYYGAPVIVLVLASAENNNADRDGSCVLENMMLAAHAIGLGSCWINRVDKMFETEEGESLRQALGLPEGLKGVGSLAIGYAAKAPRPARERKADYYKIIS